MNDALARELIVMAEEDSSSRASLVEKGELREHEYHPLMRAIHEKNNRRIKEIVSEHGWPGQKLVGAEGAKAAWLIVQHAVLEPEFQEQCVTLLKKAVLAREAQAAHLAMLYDRVLIRQGKSQLYGSQHEVDCDGKVRPLPIADPAQVDQRRKEVGLEALCERTKLLQDEHDRLQLRRNPGRES